MNRCRTFVLSVLGLVLFAHAAQAEPKVKLGIDVLREDGFASIKDRRVGLVVNPASVDSRLVPTVSVLRNAPGVELAALFGPEHGVWGDEYAGDKIDDRTDPTTGLPIYSLYGKNREPTAEMLAGIDVLVFDMQDIGSRSYTYISTLRACIEACARHDKPMIVLDRPNPLGGVRIEGGPVGTGFVSFVSFLDVPYLHGMTMGELALLARDRHAPKFDKLSVIKMQGWRRDMTWPETGLVWVPTSPHIPTFAAAVGYAVTGIAGELMQISNGVGYTQPFEIVGMPGLDGEALARRLRAYATPGDGTAIRAVRFKPFYATFKGEPCQGVQIHVDPRTAATLIEWNYRILAELDAPKLLAAAEKRHAMFDKVNGGDEARRRLSAGEDLAPMFESWRQFSEQFRNDRKQWLLYE
jgi:uncharacterized protein YbbC (DUF1343 family)